MSSQLLELDLTLDEMARLELICGLCLTTLEDVVAVRAGVECGVRLEREHALELRLVLADELASGNVKLLE